MLWRNIGKDFMKFVDKKTQSFEIDSKMNSVNSTMDMDVEKELQNVHSSTETEQLKSAVTILVHLKYILFYVKEHFFIDIEYKVNSFAPQLKADIVQCQKKYNQLIESSKYFDFVRNKENCYQTNSTIYRPLDQCFSEALCSNELTLDEDLSSKFILNQCSVSTVSVNSPANETNPKDQLQENVCQADIALPTKLPQNNAKKPKWRSTFSKPSSSSLSSSSSKTVTKNDETNNVSVVEELLNFENELLQVEYWCSFEGCRFKSKDLQHVKNHEELRHIKQVSKCFQIGCDERFDTKEELKQHINDAHSLLVTSSSNLVPQIKCEIADCDKSFPNDSKLKAHLRLDHKDEYLTCKICDRKFKTRRYVTKHFRIKHPKVKKKEVKKKSGNSRKCTIDGCNENFAKTSELKDHMMQNHRDIYLTCKFCDRVCKSRDNLTNHVWKMHQEGVFRCSKEEGCEFVATKKNDLLNHEKKHHAKTRICPIEGCQDLVRNQNYTKHLSSKHNIKNFACSWPDCGKLFGDKNKLKDHVRIHLNFKRFKCKWPECGYASEQRHTVITHVRVCHFKLPRTKKKQIEMNISDDELNRNPCDYVDACREDICV